MEKNKKIAIIGIALIILVSVIIFILKISPSMPSYQQKKSDVLKNETAPAETENLESMGKYKIIFNDDYGNIYRSNMNGSNREIFNIKREGNRELDYGISPNGNYYYYTKGGGNYEDKSLYTELCLKSFIDKNKNICFDSTSTEENMKGYENFHDIRWSYDGKYLAWRKYENEASVSIIDVTQQNPAIYSVNKFECSAFSWLPQSNRFICGGFRDTIVFDADKFFQTLGGEGVKYINFDKEKFAVIDPNPDGKDEARLKNMDCEQIALSDDEKILACHGGEGQFEGFYIFDLVGKKCLIFDNNHGTDVFAFGISPKGKFMFFHPLNILENGSDTDMKRLPTNVMDISDLAQSKIMMYRFYYFGNPADMAERDFYNNMLGKDWVVPYLYINNDLQLQISKVGKRIPINKAGKEADGVSMYTDDMKFYTIDMQGAILKLDVPELLNVQREINKNDYYMLEKWMIYDKNSNTFGSIFVTDNTYKYDKKTRSSTGGMTMEKYYEINKVFDLNTKKIKLGGIEWVEYNTNIRLIFVTVYDKYSIEATFDNTKGIDDKTRMIIEKIVSSIRVK